LKPARPRLGHPALSIGFIVVHPSVIPEGSTADNVDDDKYDEDDNVDNGDFPPTVPDTG